MSALDGRPNVGCAELIAAWTILLPIHLAFSSFVGWKLWTWFAVAALGLPAISFGQAMIGAALVSWSHQMPDGDRSPKGGDLVTRALTVILWHAVLLAIGYVGHQLRGAA